MRRRTHNTESVKAISSDSSAQIPLSSFAYFQKEANMQSFGMSVQIQMARGNTS
jgi:hypothetical protein